MLKTREYADKEQVYLVWDWEPGTKASRRAWMYRWGSFLATLKPSHNFVCKASMVNFTLVFSAVWFYFCSFEPGTHMIASIARALWCSLGCPFCSLVYNNIVEMSGGHFFQPVKSWGTESLLSLCWCELGFLWCMTQVNPTWGSSIQRQSLR